MTVSRFLIEPCPTLIVLSCVALFIPE